MRFFLGCVSLWSAAVVPTGFRFLIRVGACSWCCAVSKTDEQAVSGSVLTGFVDLRHSKDKLSNKKVFCGCVRFLVRRGYTVGMRRVARLMKNSNLLVAVKRACQTTKSLQGDMSLAQPPRKPSGLSSGSGLGG